MHAWSQAMQTLTARPSRAALRSCRVGEERPRQRDEVGVAGRQHRVGLLERVDPVRRDHRDDTTSRIARAHGSQAPCGTSSWTVGTRASCQPMPTLRASTSAAAGERRGEREHLLVRGAAVDQVGARDPVDDGPVRPDRGAHGRGHRQRERASAARASPPHSSSRQVGQRRHELVEQIALGAHDLDAVEAELGRARARRARSRRSCRGTSAPVSARGSARLNASTRPRAPPAAGRTTARTHSGRRGTAAAGSGRRPRARRRRPAPASTRSASSLTNA